MTGIAKYIEEHQLIAEVTTAFERYVDCIERGSDLEKQDLAHFIRFFREYADLGHHEKEEGQLLPAMVRHGCGWEDGPVDQVRKEHFQERYLVRSLRQAATQTDAWSEEARRRVVSTARTFVEFMRNHIRLEEDELFPRAMKCLSEDAQQEIAASFDRFDAEWNERGELAKLQELATDLVARYRQTATGLAVP